MRKANNPRLKERNTNLVKRYNELSGKKTPKGRDLYSHGAIMEMLETEFYIGQAHISRIIKNS